jgi:hypothetical protein
LRVSICRQMIAGLLMDEMIMTKEMMRIMK